MRRRARDAPGVVRALQRLHRETREHLRLEDLRDAMSRTTSGRKRTCRAAADFGFCYRTAFLGEGGGDEGCIALSKLDQ